MSTEVIRQIDIRPEVNILAVLRHLNYKPWFAVAEFVDNALSSSLSAVSRGLIDDAQSKLVVRINIQSTGNGKITILDNAYGISLADFPRAFRAAEPPPDRSGLSEFGMGMKSAASWFAKRWTVRTSTLGEAVQRSVHFDLANIAEKNMDHLPINEAIANASSHFTVIELEDLNHIPQGRTIGKIRSHLQSIYRKYLRDGFMEIWLNDEILSFSEVPVLVAPPVRDPSGPVLEWRKDQIQVDLGEGRSIVGFAALRDTGSTSEAGFALFRRGRVIVGSFDETYRPVEIFGRSNSYTYQRLFGEFELAGFDVSHTKDGIQWDEYEEKFLEQLRLQLKADPLDLLSQAEGHRVKTPLVDERKVIETAVSDFSGHLEDSLPVVVEALADLPIDTSSIVNALAEEAAQIFVRSVLIRTTKGLWNVEVTAVFDDAESSWLKVGADIDSLDNESGEMCTKLQVRISFAHPFSRNYIGANAENSEALLFFGCAVAIAVAHGKKSGARSQYVLNYLNSVLRGSFKLLDTNEGLK